jgi:lysophospholipid acyltransferase (LPLAT)-like uncharacterized protein
LEFRLYALKRDSFALKESIATHILAHLSQGYSWLLPKTTEVRKDAEQTELAQKPFFISSVWSMVMEGNFCWNAINSCAGRGLE